MDSNIHLSPKDSKVFSDIEKSNCMGNVNDINIHTNNNSHEDVMISFNIPTVLPDCKYSNLFNFFNEIRSSKEGINNVEMSDDVGKRLSENPHDNSCKFNGTNGQHYGKRDTDCSGDGFKHIIEETSASHSHLDSNWIYNLRYILDQIMSITNTNIQILPPRKNQEYNCMSSVNFDCIQKTFFDINTAEVSSTQSTDVPLFINEDKGANMINSIISEVLYNITIVGKFVNVMHARNMIKSISVYSFWPHFQNVSDKMDAFSDSGINLINKSRCILFKSSSIFFAFKAIFVPFHLVPFIFDIKKRVKELSSNYGLVCKLERSSIICNGDKYEHQWKGANKYLSRWLFQKKQYKFILYGPLDIITKLLPQIRAIFDYFRGFVYSTSLFINPLVMFAASGPHGKYILDIIEETNTLVYISGQYQIIYNDENTEKNTEVSGSDSEKNERMEDIETNYLSEKLGSFDIPPYMFHNDHTTCGVSANSSRNSKLFNIHNIKKEPMLFTYSCIEDYKRCIERLNGLISDNVVSSKMTGKLHQTRLFFHSNVMESLLVRFNEDIEGILFMNNCYAVFCINHDNEIGIFGKKFRNLEECGHLYTEDDENSSYIQLFGFNRKHLESCVKFIKNISFHFIQFEINFNNFNETHLSVDDIYSNLDQRMEMSPIQSSTRIMKLKSFSSEVNELRNFSHSFNIEILFYLNYTKTDSDLPTYFISIFGESQNAINGLHSMHKYLKFVFQGRSADSGYRSIPPNHTNLLNFEFIIGQFGDIKDFISGKKDGKLNKIMKNTGTSVKIISQGNLHYSSQMYTSHKDEYCYNHSCGALREISSNILIVLKSNDLNRLLRSFELIKCEFPSDLNFYIPENHHKRIIGHGGKNIQKIMKSFGVYVKFLNSEEVRNNSDNFRLNSCYDSCTPYISKGLFPRQNISMGQTHPCDSNIGLPNVLIKTPYKNQNSLYDMKDAVIQLSGESLDRTLLEEVLVIPEYYHDILVLPEFRINLSGIDYNLMHFTVSFGFSLIRNDFVNELKRRDISCLFSRLRDNQDLAFIKSTSSLTNYRTAKCPIGMASIVMKGLRKDINIMKESIVKFLPIAKCFVILKGESCGESREPGINTFKSMFVKFVERLHKETKISLVIVYPPVDMIEDIGLFLRNSKLFLFMNASTLKSVDIAEKMTANFFDKLGFATKETGLGVECLSAPDGTSEFNQNVYDRTNILSSKLDLRYFDSVLLYDDSELNEPLSTNNKMVSNKIGNKNLITRYVTKTPNHTENDGPLSMGATGQLIPNNLNSNIFTTEIDRRFRNSLDILLPKSLSRLTFHCEGEVQGQKGPATK